MSDNVRWIGTVLLLALLVFSKGGDGVLPVPVTDPKAEKLWVVTLDDVGTRTTKQTLVLSDPTLWTVGGHNHEHYWKPSAEAERFAAFSKFPDEAIFMDATSGKLLGVVEIPAEPNGGWVSEQIARFAK